MANREEGIFHSLFATRYSPLAPPSFDEMERAVLDLDHEGRTLVIAVVIVRRHVGEAVVEREIGGLLDLAAQRCPELLGARLGELSAAGIACSTSDIES